MGRIAALGLALGGGPAALSGCDNNIQPADTGTDSDVSDAYDADIPDVQDADISDEPDTDTPDTGIVAVSGSASDGPYVLGSEVTIVELDGTLGPTSNTIVQWTDSLGRYAADLTNNTSYMGAISGFNFDEISGSPSAARVDLRGFFRTGTSAGSYNINDFTHLVAERVKALYNGSGLTFDEASIRARDELLAELDMIISTPGCHPYEMDIISGSSDCNDPLLAVEILIRQYAHNIAEASGDPVDAVLQTVLNNAAFDFAPLGVLPDDLKDGLREAARTVDMEAAQANLDEYFAAEASGAVRPEADNVVDSDLDGDVNATDPAPLNPDIYTGHCDSDGDGFDALVCGGEDCDEYCFDCNPGGIVSCGEALDHDCDGVIDDLEGCGTCIPSTLSLVSTIAVMGGDITSVYILGDDIHVGTTGGVERWSIVDPALPMIAAQADISGVASLAMLSNMCYVLASSGVHLIDRSVGYSPVLVPGVLDETDGEIKDSAVASSQRRIFYATTEGMGSISIDDAVNPVLAAEPTEGPHGMPNDLFIVGSILYVADESGITTYAIDDGLTEADHLDIGRVTALHVAGSRAYCATTSGLSVIDVSDAYSLSTIDHVPGLTLQDVAVRGTVLYALTASSLDIYDITTPDTPSPIQSQPLGDENSVLFVNEEVAAIAGIEEGVGPVLYIIDLGC